MSERNCVNLQALQESPRSLEALAAGAALPTPSDVGSSRSSRRNRMKKKPSNKVKKFIGNLLDITVSAFTTTASPTGSSFAESEQETRRGASSDQLTVCTTTFEQLAWSINSCPDACLVQTAGGQLLPMNNDPPHASVQLSAVDGAGAKAGGPCTMHAADGAARLEALKDADDALLPILYFAMLYYALLNGPAQDGEQVQGGGGAAATTAEGEAEDFYEEVEEGAQQEHPGFDDHKGAATAKGVLTTGSCFDSIKRQPSTGRTRQPPTHSFFFRASASLAEVLEAAAPTHAYDAEPAPCAPGRTASALTTASSLASSTGAVHPAVLAARHAHEPVFMRESASLEELLSAPWGPLEEEGRGSAGRWYGQCSGSLPEAAAADSSSSSFMRPSFPAAECGQASAWPAP